MEKMEFVEVIITESKTPKETIVKKTARTKRPSTRKKRKRKITDKKQQQQERRIKSMTRGQEEEKKNGKRKGGKKVLEVERTSSEPRTHMFLFLTCSFSPTIV